MDVEYEATFINVDKGAVRRILKRSGARLVRPEFMQRRVAFDFPSGHEIDGGWLRVRDEGDKVTMSLKVISGKGIESQRETCLTIDSFGGGVELLRRIGCVQKAYQESRRELWELDGTEVTIDEWPFLEPYVEVEGRSERAVKSVSEKLGFDYGKALFCAADTVYSMKYHVSEYAVNHAPRLVFGERNPFAKRGKKR